MLLTNKNVFLALVFVTVSLGSVSVSSAQGLRGRLAVKINGGPSWKGTDDTVRIDAMDSRSRTLVYVSIDEKITSSFRFSWDYYDHDTYDIRTIYIDILGDNAVWIDAVQLETYDPYSGEVEIIKRWGKVNNGVGYCLSMDPLDADCDWCLNCEARQSIRLTL